jgi:hypothetical protein
MSVETLRRVRLRRTELSVVLTAAVASLCIAPPPTARAGSVQTVTSCADDGSPGTLRSVMLAAPRDAVIDLTHLTCSTITLEQGVIDIEGTSFDATVIGPGADRLTIDGNNQDAIFRAADLEIDGLTLTHGRAQGYGGCVQAGLSLVMRSSRVVACTSYGATSAGGGVFANYEATLYSTVVAGNMAIAGSGPAKGGGIATAYNFVKIVDSTITGNTATGNPARGGGVYSLGVTAIIGSTIDGNVADLGGGAYCQRSFFQNAECTVQDSTISGNTAHESGGGLLAKYAQTATIENSTIAYNSAETGHVGGLLLTQSGTTNITVQSSIIAKNVAAGTDLAADIDTDTGNFRTLTGGNDLFTSVGYVWPSPLIIDDPLLGPLRDNGGPTMTHALLPGSPAIDAGNNVAGLQTDQRGRARVSGPAADIGAFEVQTDAIFANGFD